MSRELFAGVMSGTSLDGIDAVLADFAAGTGACRILASARVEFSDALRGELFALQASGPDEIVRAARASNQLADGYANALRSVCASAGVAARDVIAAGVHGQTVRHRPHEGWTAQLNAAARVAERSGMPVVADFRMRDIAAGGEGAPLVPAFHAAMFHSSERHRVVANLGGIANVTDLPAHGTVRGFDTGPGNVLLDLWHARAGRGPYDESGRLAASGSVDAPLLTTLLAEPYLALPPPKSTGRDLFDAAWLDRHLGHRAFDSATVQATLATFTARSLANAIRAHCPGVQEIFLCGGGVRNDDLVARIRSELGGVAVATTDSAGVASEHVEALAFAWLARETLAGRPGNLPAVTGASGPRVLGAIYPR